ncbi:hypothetical protein ECG_06276 [Echinococcus granulosus]|nr:hypothetical protein ECG_06276 [Echinococcus granulosus]
MRTPLSTSPPFRPSRLLRCESRLDGTSQATPHSATTPASMKAAVSGERNAPRDAQTQASWPVGVAVVVVVTTVAVSIVDAGVVVAGAEVVVVVIWTTTPTTLDPVGMAVVIKVDIPPIVDVQAADKVVVVYSGDTD